MAVEADEMFKPRYGLGTTGKMGFRPLRVTVGPEAGVKEVVNVGRAGGWKYMRKKI